MCLDVGIVILAFLDERFHETHVSWWFAQSIIHRLLSCVASQVCFSCAIQIPIPCSEMEKLAIGLVHLKVTKAQFGVVAWIPMPYVLPLVLLIFQRMFFFICFHDTF